MHRFTNQVVIVTGAAGGIGKAVARRFYEERAKVVLLDVNQDAVEAVAAELGMQGGRYLAMQLNVLNEDECKRAVEKVMEIFGRIDVLNNIAGIGGNQCLMEEKPLSEWEIVYGVNVFGSVRMIKYVLPIMKQQGKGVIINTCSVSGMFGYEGESAYGSSKWAIQGLTKNIANENGGNGVRVNSIAPGWVNTSMFKKALEDHLSAGFEDSLDNVNYGPLGRPAEPEEVAAVFAFIASDEAILLNGTNLLCDGGLTLG